MKRTVATALAALAASPVLVGSVLGGTPAAAAVKNCDLLYPPGQAYKVSVGPAITNIRRGSVITIFGRVTRGGVGCNNQQVRYFVRDNFTARGTYKPAGYTATRAIYLGDGFAPRTGAPQRTFRFFIRFNTQNSVSALVVVRR